MSTEQGVNSEHSQVYPKNKNKKIPLCHLSSPRKMTHTKFMVTCKWDLVNIYNRFFPSQTEVVRTRLREEGTKYRSFFQTLSLLVQEEGYGSLYRGLTTHLVRQIPNTAILMATYEVVVYLLNG